MKKEVKMNEIRCIKCGTSENLLYFDEIIIRQSKSNNNIMRFTNSYICKSCKNLCYSLKRKIIKGKNNDRNNNL